MATLFLLGCLVSELRVREGIFKKLYQRRPNKNVAGVNYVDETDLKVSCKRSVSIPRSKSQVLSCVKKIPKTNLQRVARMKGWTIGMKGVTGTSLRLTLRLSRILLIAK